MKYVRPEISRLVRNRLVLAVATVVGTGMPAMAATHNPANSAALTTLLNGSTLQLGDTIVLNAGTVYEGTFTLPNKTTGSGYITIRSSAHASLPPRVGV